MAVGAQLAPRSVVPWPKRLRRAVRSYALLSVLWTWSLLPLGLALALGRGLGRIVAFVAVPVRRRVERHLAIAFPEIDAAERGRLARACLAHLGMCLAEVVQIRRLDARLERYVEFDDTARSVLESVLAEGKGAVVVTGHVGHWELLARRVALVKPLSVVGRELNTPKLTEVMDRWRGSGRVMTLWRGRQGAAKEMLRVFRDNGVLGLLIDQDTKVQSVFVPFFGRPAATPRAAGDLCVRTGAGLVAAFVHRTATGHRISMERIDVARTGDRDTDGVALTAAATAAIERAIREAPHEWVWMHERWKTRPEDLPATPSP